MTETRTWTRCILLIPEGFDETEHLKRLVASRDWIAVQQHDPWLAMAELCIRRRAISSRSSWGLPASEQLSLVIADPTRWMLQKELVEAVRRFAPNVGLWCYQNRRLDALQADPPAPIDTHQKLATDSDREKNKHEIDPALSSPSPPFTPDRPLHMASSVPTEPEIVVLERDGQNGSDEGENEEPTSITPEEIEMLLAVPPRDEDES